MTRLTAALRTRPDMRRLLPAGLIWLAIACGGSPAPAATTGTGQMATQPPAGQPAPVTQAPGGGQGIADFCLNTREEVAAALQVDLPTAAGNENPGFGGGCIYSAADGSLVWSVGIVPVTPQADLIATGLQTPGAVAIEGIGEGAVLISAQGPLVFRRGNWFVSSGGNPTLPIASNAAAYRAAMETLARAAAGRI